jgi:hypothetical protein
MRLSGGAASSDLRLSVVDPFPFDQKYMAPPEVLIDGGWSQIADALIISHVIVVGDECRDLGFEIARQVIVLEQDAPNMFRIDLVSAALPQV